MRLSILNEDNEDGDHFDDENEDGGHLNEDDVDGDHFDKFKSSVIPNLR